MNFVSFLSQVDKLNQQNHIVSSLQTVTSLETRRVSSSCFFKIFFFPSLHDFFPPPFKHHSPTRLISHVSVVSGCDLSNFPRFFSSRRNSLCPRKLTEFSVWGLLVSWEYLWWKTKGNELSWSKDEFLQDSQSRSASLQRCFTSKRKKTSSFNF